MYREGPVPHLTAERHDVQALCAAHAWLFGRARRGLFGAIRHHRFRAGPPGHDLADPPAASPTAPPAAVSTQTHRPDPDAVDRHAGDRRRRRRRHPRCRRVHRPRPSGPQLRQVLAAAARRSTASRADGRDRLSRRLHAGTAQRASRRCERRHAVTPDTPFVVGSITKTFVAAAIMQLQEEGELSLDDPLSDWLPDYPNAENITLRQLLSHTSGLFNYFEHPSTTRTSSTSATTTGRRRRSSTSSSSSRTSSRARATTTATRTSSCSAWSSRRQPASRWATFCTSASSTRSASTTRSSRATRRQRPDQRWAACRSRTAPSVSTTAPTTGRRSRPRRSPGAPATSSRRASDLADWARGMYGGDVARPRVAGRR